MRRHAVPSALVALLAVAACATAPRHAALTRATASLEPLRQNVIAKRELPPADTRSALDVVTGRWPDLARGPLPRGAGLRLTPEPWPAVRDRFGVYDAQGTFLGGPEYLAGVQTADVRQLRRLTEMEEHAAFGHRHPAGAVVLTWMRGADR